MTTCCSKKVTPPNGQSFVARYKRVSRKNLHRNTTIKKVQKIGLRQRRKTQKGGSIIENIVKLGTKLGSKFGPELFKRGISTGTRVLNSELGQKLIDEGIMQAPNLYRLRTPKIKNINVKKALESDVANYLVEETQQKTKNKKKKIYLVGYTKRVKVLVMFKLKKTFKNIGDGDINNNFVAAFPSNHINKFIDH